MRRRVRVALLAAGLVALAAVAGVLYATGDEPAAAPDERVEPIEQPFRVGDCFDDPGALDPDDPIPTVACDEPHDHEVFHTFEYAQADGPPPEDIAIERTNDECIPAFEAFVGVPFEESELGFYPLEPTDRQWRNGERTVRCAILTMDGSKLTGSVRGAER